jgi:WD40-like Beta Propeller Repeat
VARKPIALTIICLVALLAGAQAAQATFAGRPGLIASGAQDGIHVFKPDGSGDRVVAGLADARDPAWSANGRRIVFSARPDGNPFHLYVVNVGSGKTRQVTFAAQSDSAPSWAPDGKSIVFVRDMPHDDAVFRIRATGGHIRQLTEAQHIHDVELSPTGEDYAWVTGATVGIGNADTGSTHTFIDFQAGDGEQQPGSVSWAPNGRRLAIGTVANAACDQCSEIFIARGDGSHLHPITTGDPAGYGRPFYRPRGGRVAFCLSEFQPPAYNVVSELRLMKQNGKHPHTIGSLCGTDWQPLPPH